MKKFVALAALVTVSAAIAAPASAANLVRVSLAGKTSVEINNAIKAAAETVCAGEKPAMVAACLESTTYDANRQLASILKARSGAPKVWARRESVSVVRVSLKGKSTDQIHAEIRAAAEAVCKASPAFHSRSDYRACVGGTVRSAKAQLQAMTAQPKQLASL
jgi:UrcA family protein